MGNGKRLKEILDEKKIRVSDLAKRTNINQQTLYSIINRDYNIRYDFAFRIANALDIDVSEICDVTLSDDYFPDIINKSGYIKHRTGELLKLFNENELPLVDHLLADFYPLTKKAKKKLFEYLDLLSLSEDNKDKTREQEIKDIIK